MFIALGILRGSGFPAVLHSRQKSVKKVDLLLGHKKSEPIMRLWVSMYADSIPCDALVPKYPLEAEVWRPLKLAKDGRFCGDWSPGSGFAKQCAGRCQTC